MAAIALMQSPRLSLVDCQVTEGMVKAGWCFTYGLLQPIEKLEFDGKVTAIHIPEFMQQDAHGGELFDPHDTVDFLVVV